jgi:RNA polymerase sigma-70 factor (ECF subfamily)
MVPADARRDACDDDRLLLAQVAAGDQETLRALYAAYAPRLWRFLLQQLGANAGWAEEVLQDVFVAVWRSAGGYRGEAHVATWIFRIAHHLAANARRDRARRPEGHLVELPEDAEEGALIGLDPSCEDAVLGRLALADALERISPRHRAVIELVFAQGFSCEEVARILGVPAGTVKSRLSYARRALRDRLATSAGAER